MARTSSLAYGVYFYPEQGQTTPSPTGEVGRVDFDNTIPALSHYNNGSSDGNIQNLTSDPKVFWFQNPAGQSRLLVAQTQYDANFNPLPSQFSVYNADTLQQVWPASGTQTWGDLINVYAIETVGNYLYGIDYDKRKVFRVQMAATGDNYTFDANTVYTYDDGVSGNQKFGVDIATDGSAIYALFIRGPNVFGGNYVNSTVVKLPLALGNTPTAVNANLAPNAVNLKLWTDSQSTTYIYIPAIGGKQNDDGTYNAGSKIQRVDAATLQTLDTLLINAASGTGGGINTTDYYDIAFNAAGTKVFILKGIYDPPPEGSSLSVGPFNWYLFGTNMGAINAKAPSGGLINTVTGITSTSGNFQGYVWALEYDVADDKTWFAQGNRITVYDQGGRSPASQGNPLGMGAGSSYLAPADFFLNGVSVYGVVGTINGAQSPSNASVQAPAAEEEE